MILKKIKVDSLEEKLKELNEQNKHRRIRQTKQNNGIIVKGIDNCLVRLAKCCNPVPGDEIIGYITKGRGVSVHRKDCKNADNLILEDDEHRMIDVAWIEDEKSSYNVDVMIYSNDRDHLLADIINTVSNLKASLMNVSSKVTKERIVITELTVNVEDIDRLNEIIKALRKVDSVYEVRRKKE